MSNARLRETKDLSHDGRAAARCGSGSTVGGGVRLVRMLGGWAPRTCKWLITMVNNL